MPNVSKKQLDQFRMRMEQLQQDNNHLREANRQMQNELRRLRSQGVGPEPIGSATPIGECVDAYLCRYHPALALEAGVPEKYGVRERGD